MHGDRVKRRAVAQRKAEVFQPLCQRGGELRNTLGDVAQPIGAMVDRIHAGHDGGQHLRGTDVGGGFFAADVLLSGL